MLTEPSRNLVAAAVEKEAGWLLLSSLLASMPKEVRSHLRNIYFVLRTICMLSLGLYRQELEDQVFDILSLWATIFSGNPEHEIKQTGDLTSRIW